MLIDHENPGRKLSLQRQDPNGQWVSWSQLFYEGDEREGCDAAAFASWIRECVAKYPGFTWRVKVTTTEFVDVGRYASTEGRRQVAEGIACLQRARALFKAAGNLRTLERVRLALSSAKGAARIQIGREIRAERAAQPTCADYENAECTSCGEIGACVDSTWQQWQCGACGKWNERGILPATEAAHA